MPKSLDQLREEPESDALEKKSSLDPSSSKDMLGLIADIVAMSNTRGGGILVGTHGAPLGETALKLFDSARLDDKVNSFSEPRVGGIRSFQFGSEFLFVEVEQSKNPPHMMKKEGNYSDPDKGQQFVFRSHDILVRHSSKTERATRSDLDRMFIVRQNSLLEKVKMVFEAPAGTRIQVVEDGVGPPVRIDPSDPAAQPVYDVLTSSPFRDIQQELVGAVKSWRTSSQLLNETQIMKAYLQRDDIAVPEVLEVLLRSCWDRHMPGFWWASRIEPASLPRILEAGIRTDAFTGSVEALKISSLLPRVLAAKLFELALECKKKSVSKMAKKLDPVMRARTRKSEKFLEIFFPWPKINYAVSDGLKTVDFGQVNEGVFNEIVQSVLAGAKENRGPFKTIEAILYANAVASLHFAADSELESSGEA